MRQEDIRPGSGINKISGSDRGPLTWSEKEALRVQHGNRSADGKTWADNERDRMSAITTDATLKRPRFYG